MKFRNCFFEYDGVYSGKYNLRLVYVENSNHNFDSGGGFDFKFGQIPYSHEQLYYGKDYSANPLQFEIEILNIDGYITDEQMIEIKEWLFGGNGWKKFKPLNGTNNKSLRCILTPIADITEGNHYKGLRFSLRNASPFWYGEENEIIIENFSNYTYYNNMLYSAFNIEIPDNDDVDCIIMPKLFVNINKTSSGLSNVKEMNIVVTEAKSIADGLSYTTKDNKDIWNYPDKSGIACDISYIGNSGDTTALDTIEIDTHYVTFNSINFADVNLSVSIDMSNPLRILRLKKGINICRIRYGQMYSSIIVKYTPLYRMGAF